MAFTSSVKSSDSSEEHQIRVVAKGLISTQTLPDLPKGNFESKTGDLWKLEMEDFFNFTTCITINDIQSISIVAGSTDAWNINSIVTYAVIDSECWQLMSADYNVDQWIDDSDVKGRREFLLSLTTIGPCMQYLYVMAYTSGDTRSETQPTVNHKIEIKADGLTKTATLSNLPSLVRGQLWTLSLDDDFGFTSCIRVKDVQGIAIVADHVDGWKIDSIATYLASNKNNWKLSSVDLDVNQWVYLHTHKRFQLNLVI